MNQSSYHSGRGVSEGEALGDVAQVKVLDVEDVLRGRRVGRIRAHKRIVSTRSQLMQVPIL